MAVKIRLRRMGTRHKPFYRIVVADSRTSRDGRFIELIGTYDTRQDPPVITLENDKAKKWLENGAQPSDVVRALLVKTGLLEKGRAPQMPDKLEKPEPVKPKAKPKTEKPASSAEEKIEEPAAEAVSEQPAAEEAPAEPVAEAPAEKAVEEVPAEEQV